MKFTKAYVDSLDMTMSFDEIRKYHDTNLEYFIEKINGHLLCPQCMQAKLKYCNAKNPYLSCYPKSKHSDNCALIPNANCNYSFRTLMRNKTERNFVVRKIVSIYIRFLTKIGADVSDNNSQLDSSVSKKGKKPIKNKVINDIKIKSLNRKFKEDDYGVPKIFKGEVIITFSKKTTEKSGNTYHLLTLAKVDGKNICELKITNKVYKYLDDDIKKLNKTYCFVVFAAKFKKIKEERIRASLPHSECIKIKRL